jgi:hypothetical protein
MRRLLLLFVLLAGPTTALAGELQPATIAHLRELGIDPKSERVTAIASDQIGSFSLDSIAASRGGNAVRYFIETRNFIRKFRQDTKTPFPPNDIYQIRYLTPDEMQFIRKALGGKLQPKAAAFLEEIGMDLKSTQVTAILGDEVVPREGVPITLDSLAAIRNEDGVKQFIATRNFVRQYQQDTKTRFPPSELYQTRYLKPDEVQFILKALKAPAK